MLGKSRAITLNSDWSLPYNGKQSIATKRIKTGLRFAIKSYQDIQITDSSLISFKARVSISILCFAVPVCFKMAT